MHIIMFHFPLKE